MKTLLSNVGLTSKAEDSTIIPINKHQSLITNIDIFTAIHDDPFIMGKIAANNVTNDIFALNAVKLNNFSTFLGLPTDIPDSFPEKIMQGMRAFLKEIGGDVMGGHTIYNPWPLFGGTASAIIDNDRLIPKRGIKKDDIILVTKPMGVQPVMAAYRLFKTDPTWLEDFDKNEIKKAIRIAEKMMTTSNQPVVKVIHKGNYYKIVHAMTDVTGFGITGHLKEMLDDSEFGATLNYLPVIKTSPELADLMGYRLEEGLSPEISGAMLMSVDRTNFRDFTQDLSDSNIWWREIGFTSNKFKGIKFSDSYHLEEIDQY